jgi:hypothetical protein
MEAALPGDDDAATTTTTTATLSSRQQRTRSNGFAYSQDTFRSDCPRVQLLGVAKRRMTGQSDRNKQSTCHLFGQEDKGARLQTPRYKQTLTNSWRYLYNGDGAVWSQSMKI